MAQENIHFFAKVKGIGFFSSEEVLPGWFYTNTNTAVSEFSTVSGKFFARSTYSFKESTKIEAGFSGFYRNEIAPSFQRNNFYLRFKNNWFQATIGAKNQKEEAFGLSLTNKNFVWSNNARAIPGFIIEASTPLKLSKTFSVDWGIGNYFLNDTRYVSNTMIHYKRLAIIAKINDNSKLKIRLQHVAQWGGTSPEFGKLPTDFSAFVKVFFAKKTNTEGENVNALGNHIGSFFVDYVFSTQVGSFNVYYDHPFEDGSGTRFANFPDGLWGLTFTPKKTPYFFLYEFATTTNQSGNTGVSGFDNYFSNNLYRSGWTYEGNVIGFPFITSDKNIEITNLTSPIVSNRIQAHHFAFSGKHNALSWKLKTTFAKHLGTYRQPYSKPVKVWSNALFLTYGFKKYGNALLQLGFDNGSNKNIFAIGLGYEYKF